MLKFTKECIKKFGLDLQVDMVIEEMAELIVAINHHKRNKCGLNDVIEEMADVDITLNQLKIMYNCEAKFEELKIETKNPALRIDNSPWL